MSELRKAAERVLAAHKHSEVDWDAMRDMEEALSKPEQSVRRLSDEERDNIAVRYLTITNHENGGYVFDEIGFADDIMEACGVPKDGVK